jgi:acyl carrier protein
MSDIEKIIREIVAAISGLPPNMPGHSNLYLDLGVASLQALQLLRSLEERFNLNVPDEEFVDATSIDALTLLIVSALSAAGEAAEKFPNA